MAPYKQPELPLTEVPTARSTASQPGAPSHPVPNPTSHRPPPPLSPAQNGTSEKPPPSAIPRPAGRRRRQLETPPTPDQSKDDPLNRMGHLYTKILRYSTGTRYSIYILPIALLLAIPVIVSATQVSSNPAQDPKIGGVRVVWFFTWIEAVWLTFWGVRFVARALPKIFGFFAGVVSSSTKKYARVLENLQQPVTIFGWVAISLVLFEVLFSTSSAGNTPQGWTTKFKQVLGAILVASIIFLIEKFLVQLISVNYHRRSFNYRIEASRRAVYLLGLLFEASRTLFPMYEGEFLEEDYVIRANLEAFVRKGHREVDPRMEEAPEGHRRRRFGGIGRLGNKVNSVFGNIASELTGKRVLPPRSAQSIVIECLERKRSSKALAQRLWYSFVVEANDSLHLSDVQEVLASEPPEVVDECFDLLDPDGNTDVTLDETIMKVIELCEERKAIAKSMHDVSEAIKALDNVLSAVALLISIFTLISFLDTGFRTILSTASTTLLSLSFVFSATAQEFLGSCIFLFVKHPFDIGDRVHIQGPDGLNQLEVAQMALLYTTFKRITDLELVQIPNIVLNSLWVNNISRSRGLMERLDVFISFDTSLEDIDTLRQEMEKFVTHADNVRDYHSDIVLRCLGVGNMDKLQLQLEVRHKSNWSVETVRASRHSKLMCALVLALRKVPIFGPGGGGAALGDPANPAYSVTVSDEIATTARDKAAKVADAARLHPVNVITANSAVKSEPSTETGGYETLASIPESMSANALNAVKVSEQLSEDQEADYENTSIVGSSELHRSTTRMSAASGASPELQKTKSPQGRRRAGHSVSSGTSTMARQDTGALVAIPQRTRTGDFDQEAQRLG